MPKIRGPTRGDYILLGIGILAFSIGLAWYRHDFVHWYKYLVAVLLYLLLGVIAFVFQIGLGALIHLFKIVLKKITFGKINLLAQLEEERKMKEERDKKHVDKNKQLKDWYSSKFKLTYKDSYIKSLAALDEPKWHEGVHDGVPIAFHDPNPYHFEIFVGRINESQMANLSRVYNSVPLPPAGSPKRLDSIVGSEGAELARKFFLTAPRKTNEILGFLQIAEVRKALLALSASVYLVGTCQSGVELRIAKEEASPETAERDISRAFEIYRELVKNS